MTIRGFLAGALVALALPAAACLDMAPPQATVYVFNSEPTAVVVRVTDNETCQLGLTADLGQNTRTTYDVDAAKGGFVCIGKDAKKGFPVKPGGHYMVKGDTLVDDPNPDAAGGGGGGLLETLEAAGRDAQGG